MIKHFIFLFLISPFILKAQNNISSEKNTTRKAKPTGNQEINISLFNHAIALPFYKIIRSPLHPGVQFGTELRMKESAQAKLFQTINLGMFYNAYNGMGYYLNSQFSYRRKIKCGIYAEGGLGLGYLRIFHPTDIYELTASGVYEKAKDTGFSSPIVSYAMAFGYNVKTKKSISFSPFIRYESFIQTRYNDEVPVLPHASFQLGVKILKNRAK